MYEKYATTRQPLLAQRQREGGGVVMASYSIVQADEIAQSASLLRRKRLNKVKNNWLLGITYDVLFGALPWVVGAASVAAGLVAIYVNVEGSAETFLLFDAPVAIGAISTCAGFLLVGNSLFRTTHSMLSSFALLLTRVCLDS
jgi:hypothetical protein